ncbi:MAG: hypothetical protein Ct9H300mP28_27190 [Pseudomonadota bacterium]|nr:MAG: hypothetical protein Ct9H300mP28_27190 [Pseudomonadota bacterium]
MHKLLTCLNSKPRRKLAAILAADVVGFSKMMGENEDRTLRNLKACRTLTDESVKTHHGRVFGSAGDSIIAEFGSPVDAIVAREWSSRKTCGIEITKLMKKTKCSSGWV